MNETVSLVGLSSNVIGAIRFAVDDARLDEPDDYRGFEEILDRLKSREVRAKDVPLILHEMETRLVTGYEVHIREFESFILSKGPLRVFSSLGN